MISILLGPPSKPPFLGVVVDNSPAMIYTAVSIFLKEVQNENR